ncbi:MAG: hypothetical protein C0404_14470 [Verrucomicrobia bacterium]|nr:hypothetical protein [Verrucomicrobiota bacterium]
MKMKKLIAGMIGVAGVCACLYGAEDKPVELFPVVQGGKWGYMDKTGKLAIKPQYECAWDFSDGLACVQVDLMRGYINEKGETVIKPQYVFARPFSEGMAAAFKGAGKWGDFVLFMYDGVDANKHWVYVDKAGVEHCPKWPFFYSADEFHEGFAIVRTGFGKSLNMSAVKKDATQVSPEKKYMGRMSEGMIAFGPGPGKYGFMDQAFKEAIAPTYEDAGDFSEGLAAVALMLDVNDPARATTWTKGGKYVLNGRNGAEGAWGTNSIPMEDGESVAFGATKTFTFGVRAPAKMGRYNFQWQLQTGWESIGEASSNVAVTVTNTPVNVPPAADAAPKTAAAAPAPAVATAGAGGKRLENGARFVSQSVPEIMTTGQIYTVSVTLKNTGAREKKWGYIDKTGKKVIDPQYQGARQFSEGLAPVMVDGKWGYIDKTAKMVINPQFDSGNSFSEGLARIVVGAKHGFIDATGKVVTEPKFDCAWEFSKGLARVIVEGKGGYIDKTGKYVWEPKESMYAPSRLEAGKKQEPGPGK